MHYFVCRESCRHVGLRVAEWLNVHVEHFISKVGEQDPMALSVAERILKPFRLLAADSNAIGVNLTSVSFTNNECLSLYVQVITYTNCPRAILL